MQPANDLNPWAYAWTLPADGVYTLQARARDHVGNLGLSAQVNNITVDGTPPVATLSWSGNIFATPNANNQITLSGTASDNLAGLQRVDICIDGRTFVTTDFTPGLSTGFTYVWKCPPTSRRRQGTHVITVRARDNSGNLSTPSHGAHGGGPVAAHQRPDHPPIPKSTHARLALRRAHHPVWPRQRCGLPTAAAQPGAACKATLDALNNGTVYFNAENPNDTNAGVSMAWAGDVDGDRRADYVAGLPAANSGHGPRACGVWPQRQLPQPAR